MTNSIPHHIFQTKGKVSSRQKNGDYIYTRLTVPAADEYSSPQTLDIRSKKSIGQVGEFIEQECFLIGYMGKEYSYKDKETGEIIKRRPVNYIIEALQNV